MRLSPPEAIDARDFREAMSRWASGVAVVAVRDAQGVAATTVSSFSSLSLTPPLVLVALTDASRTLKRVEESGRFTVSVLTSAQQDVSVRCAKGDVDEATFDEAARVHGSLVSLSCTVHDVRRYGDHLLLVGQVVGVRHGAEGAPLLYWNRAYRALT